MDRRNMRQTLKPVLLFCLLQLCWFTVTAQTKEYTLSGYVSVPGEGNCKYRIGFSVTGSAISGYSVTYLSDKTEMKASIAGAINRKKETLTFKETPVPGFSQGADCLFDARLKSKTIATHTFLMGTYNGTDSARNDCGKGSIVFEVPPEMNDLFNEPTSEGRPQVTLRSLPPALPEKHIVQQLKKTEPPKADVIALVTATQQQSFDWRSDSCILEIWDAEVADGDALSILLNGQIVLENFTISGDKKVLHLALPRRNSSLTIVAIDEGKAPPCTSRLLLTDGNRRYDILARLEKGQQALISLRMK